MQIYDNILALQDRFKVFLFDAFGTFWTGNDFYTGSTKVMAQLITAGKTVCILSNSIKTAYTDEVYSHKIPEQSPYFQHFITSGVVLRTILEKQQLYFQSQANPQNVYVFGMHGKEVFRGTKYQVVDNLAQADFVYIATPKFTDAEYMTLADKSNVYQSVEAGWNVVDLQPFMPILKDILAVKLPILNANPDIKVRQPVKHSDQIIFALRNGAIAAYLRQQGAEVVELGKPNLPIYDFTFQYLQEQGLVLPDRHQICMIGDGLLTDIKGANNAGIVSILCTETGITAMEVAAGHKLEDLVQSSGAMVDYYIRGVVGN